MGYDVTITIECGKPLPLPRPLPNAEIIAEKLLSGVKAIMAEKVRELEVYRMEVHVNYSCESEEPVEAEDEEE
jgi:hypothetical protein